MEKICIGKPVRLHGYLGQMKITTKIDADFDINAIDKMFDENGNEFKVNRIFKTKDGIVVGLDSIDLESAKKMINKPLFIDRKLVDGKILIEDLKGSSVYFEDGELIGKITDVQDYGAAEVFYMNGNDEKEVLFPNVKGLIENFDYRQKKLVVNKRRFLEVASNEDWYTYSFSK